MSVKRWLDERAIAVTIVVMTVVVAVIFTITVIVREKDSMRPESQMSQTR